MDFFKKNFLYLLLLLPLGFVMSCDKDDDKDEDPIPAVDRGNVHPNRIKFEFINSSDTTKKFTYEYYDIDGSGGQNPIVMDTIMLEIANTGGVANYKGEVKFYRDSALLNSQIRSLGHKYIVCYRDQYFYEFEPSNFDRDANNVVLGLKADWEIEDRPSDQSATGQGNLRVTLNYNILAKDGTCDAGVLVFDGTLPYKLKVN